MKRGKMVRRALAVWLVLCLVALSGCDNSPATAGGPGWSEISSGKNRGNAQAAPADAGTDVNIFEPVPAPAEEQPADAGSAGLEGFFVGVCIYSFDDSFMTLYRDELEQQLIASGAEAFFADAMSDQAMQLSQIENCIAQGVDLLIVNLVQPAVASMVADLCSSAGVPVVFVNRAPDDAEIQRWEDEGLLASYVGVDAAQAGALQGEMVAALPDRGDANGDGVVRVVAITGEPGMSEAKQRTESAIAAMEAAGVPLEVMLEQPADWSQALAQEVMENVLAAYGTDGIDVVLCNNDAMALGALNAIEAAGLQVGRNLYLFGIDAMEEALERVLEGRLSGTVLNDPREQARVAVNMAAQYAYGSWVDSRTVGYVAVTEDNAAQILRGLH